MEALVQKGGRADSGAGFGAAASKPRSGGKKKKAKAAAPPRSVLGKELSKSGVVRINGALSPGTADALRNFVDDERQRALSEVEARRPGFRRCPYLHMHVHACEMHM